ncbi:MAG: LysR family transcriptional regulator [Burkholderiaceae bacterium]|nr:LysR family transcriptional regulator [Burkholderiaceae bacterium]
MKLVIQPNLLLKAPNYHQQSLDLSHIGNLLKSVEQGRTLASAAKDLNISYRTVWNELKEAEQELGCRDQRCALSIVKKVLVPVYC